MFGEGSLDFRGFLTSLCNPVRKFCSNRSTSSTIIVLGVPTELQELDNCRAEFLECRKRKAVFTQLPIAKPSGHIQQEIRKQYGSIAGSS